MSAKTATETSTDTQDATNAPATPGGMHRPKHGALDTIETAALDEVQHEAALRDSALRPPR